LSTNKSNIGKRKEEIEKREENVSSAVGGSRLEAVHLKIED